MKVLSADIAPGCTDDSVAFVGEYLREIDRVETRLSSGLGAREVVRRSVDISGQVWTVRGQGAVGVFGVARGSIGGIPWFLGTSGIERVIVGVIPFIRAAVKRYGYLYNYVWSGNRVSARWLEKTGFRVGRPVRYGVAGAMFHYFDMGDVLCAIR